MEHIFIVIMLGSLWGIFEATVGYFLHMLALPIGSYLWYPIAFFFINKAYQMTKSYKCVFFTALTAASFKLLDLFFPVRIDMVINPSVSIILEAISYILVYQYVKANSEKLNFFHILLTGFMWRAFYLCYVLLMPESIMMISPAADIIAFTKFMFLYNVGNCVLIYLCCLISNKVPKSGIVYERIRIKQMPVFSAFLLLAAIAVKFITR